MSTIRTIEDICSVCGTKTRYRVYGSTNMMAAPDLDSRPSEMARSTINLKIHECPNCHFTSTMLSDKRDVTEEYLKTEAYLNCDGRDFESYLAEKFYRSCKIALLSDDYGRAFDDMIHAAWACDDADDAKNASFCREQAAAYILKLLKDPEYEEAKEQLLVIKADLLRRSGYFDELISEYSQISFENELYNKIREFQIKKAKEKDKGCYTYRDDDKSFKPGFTIIMG